MVTIGLDIGTTTASAVLFHTETGESSVRTQVHHAAIPATAAFESIQDPAVLLQTATGLLDAMLELCGGKAAAIGMTGQMHGILYLDENGEPVSPLYTWQDDRGNQPLGSESYASALMRLSGYPAASGYGLTTHFYNANMGLVPSAACRISTIHDYIAMKLCGLQSPVTDSSDAASLGLYDLSRGCFDLDALQRADIDPAILPAIVPNSVIGTFRGVPVCVPIGDNQASFYGTTGGRTDGLLVNVGTGSQFSAHCAEPLNSPGLELRPYPGGGYLLVGATLCGGKAYALLERFFADVVKMVTGTDVADCYDAMARRLGEMGDVPDAPHVRTTFDGTRSDPDLRGSFEEIGVHNMTAGHFTAGVLQGICAELHQMYEGYLASGGMPRTLLFGSGNGLRKNRYLQKAMADAFSLPLLLSPHQEEAAIGAAQFAAHCIEGKSTTEANT